MLNKIYSASILGRPSSRELQKGDTGKRSPQNKTRSKSQRFPWSGVHGKMDWWKWNAHILSASLQVTVIVQASSNLLQRFSGVQTPFRMNQLALC